MSDSGDMFETGVVFGFIIGVFVAIFPPENVNIDIYKVATEICSKNGGGVTSVELDPNPLKYASEGIPAYARYAGSNYDITCANGGYFEDVYIGEDFYLEENGQ